MPVNKSITETKGQTYRFPITLPKKIEAIIDFTKSIKCNGDKIEFIFD